MPFPFDPAPATIWTLTADGKTASCELRFVPIGVEARVLVNGKLLYSRIFPTADESLAWTEEERKRHLAKGWIPANAMTCAWRI